MWLSAAALSLQTRAKTKPLTGKVQNYYCNLRLRELLRSVLSQPPPPPIGRWTQNSWNSFTNENTHHRKSLCTMWFDAKTILITSNSLWRQEIPLYLLFPKPQTPPKSSPSQYEMWYFSWHNIYFNRLTSVYTTRPWICIFYTACFLGLLIHYHGMTNVSSW